MRGSLRLFLGRANLEGSHSQRAREGLCQALETSAAVCIVKGRVKMDKQHHRYRWTIFYTVLIVYFLVVSQRTAPGLITDQLMKQFDVSAAMIGLMTSVQFLAYASLQIPIGLLSDRYGPNRFLILGALFNGVGTILYSVAPDQFVLIASRFIVGIGDATIFINFIAILSQWFQATEFVKLLGIIGLAGGLGSLMATIPFSLWISIAGWRLPFLSVGLVLSVFSYLLYNVLVVRPKRILGVSADVKSSAAQNPNSAWLTLRRLLSTRQAWATFMCHFGVVGTYVGFVGSWGVPYGIRVLGLSLPSASGLMMWGLFGAMIGGPLSSLLAGRYGMIKTIYTAAQMLVVLSWTVWLIWGANPSYWLVGSLLLFIGLGNGASTLTFALVRKSFTREVVGVASGMANTGGFLSAVLLPSAFGFVLDLFPRHAILTGYHTGLLIPALFSIVGLIGVRLVQDKNEPISVPSVA